MKYIYHSIPALKHYVFKFQGFLSGPRKLITPDGRVILAFDEYKGDRIYRSGAPFQDHIRIIMVKKTKVYSAVPWGRYTESLRYSACQFAKEFGWTVHYIHNAESNRDAVNLAIKEHQS